MHLFAYFPNSAHNYIKNKNYMSRKDLLKTTKFLKGGSIFLLGEYRVLSNLDKIRL